MTLSDPDLRDLGLARVKATTDAARQAVARRAAAAIAAERVAREVRVTPMRPDPWPNGWRA
jgi:hypothetical protein